MLLLYLEEKNMNLTSWLPCCLVVCVSSFLSFHGFAVVSPKEIEGPGSLLYRSSCTLSYITQFSTKPRLKLKQSLSLNVCSPKSQLWRITCALWPEAVCSVLPCRDCIFWALYSLLRPDVNKFPKAFGQARQRNCSEAIMEDLVSSTHRCWEYILRVKEE